MAVDAFSALALVAIPVAPLAVHLPFGVIVTVGAIDGAGFVLTM